MKIWKTNSAQFHVYEVSKIVKLIKSGARMTVTRGWGKVELLINRHNLSVK